MTFLPLPVDSLHYAFLEDVPADEAAAVMQELPKLAKAVRIATGAKGVNVAQVCRELLRSSLSSKQPLVRVKMQSISLVAGVL